MGTFKKALPWLVLAAVVGLVAWKLHSSHFDWAGFGRSLKTADLRLVGLGLVVVWSNNLLRAMRWAVFLRPALRQEAALNNAEARKIHWWNLVGSQFVGFTGLAIFGRIGELIRPLLVARRTGLTFSSQVAVVTVERVFDLGAFGLLFSLNLLFSPALRSLPYLSKAGYTIGGLTVAIGIFVALVRLAGELVAKLAKAMFGMASKSAGEAVAAKILSFRDGLNVIDSMADFAMASFLSMALWLTIALAYVLVLKAFPPPVHDLTVAHTIVLLGFSIAGSALPIPGGGGALATIAFALANLFAVPPELASSAALLVWLVTTLGVVPVGLIFAKFEGVSLGQMAKRSEAAA
jgi:uncharacterized protein (TIRG00374 family)